MGTDRSGNELDSKEAPALSACPLSHRDQTRNLVLYGINVSLIYLSAPVVYVGLTQSSLCDELGETTKMSNMPAAVYFWGTPLPILVAWAFSSIRLLKPVLVVSYLLTALVGGLVAVSLLLPTNDLVVPALLVHAAVLGCTLGVVATYQWEVLGRGVAESRRGQALALAFGVGPIFAVLGSLLSQLILDGEVGFIAIEPIAFPYNFAVLFATTVPILLVAAFLSTWFVVPHPPIEVARKPFFSGVFGGFGEFISYRLILIAALAMILVTAGYNILQNISLYTKVVTGERGQNLVGYQNSLRFGFKVVAGLLLGWLLTKTNPRAGMLLTTLFCLMSVAWAVVVPDMWVPDMWILISFGLMGAGELFGVYFPNYILCCSAKSRMRRNMAFTSMLNMPSGFASVLYGSIVDTYGKVHGKKSGFEMSFVVSIFILIVTLLLIVTCLPSRPRPRESDTDPSDRAADVPATESASPAVT